MVPRHFVVVCVSFFLFFCLCVPSFAVDAHSLERIIQKVRKDYLGVSHLPAHKFVDILKSERDVVIFDVREKDEHKVSHIAGSIRVDPGIWTSSFIREFGESVKNKTVVLYCAVGVRSSRLAKRVQEQLKKNGAKSVYNLEGGIFAWHNLVLDLENKTGKTDFVHPYNSYWGQLIKRKELLRSHINR